MNKFIGVLILGLILSCETNQNDSCNCESELNFVIQYYEKNLPAYHVDITNDNREDYEQHKSKLLKDSKSTSKVPDCFKLITLYTEYFKDKHSRLAMNFQNIDETDPLAVEEFLNSDLFKSREIIPIEANHKKQYPIDELRGVYSDDTYTVAVIPQKNSYRDYVGVILESKTKLWKKGQIKFEIKVNTDKNTAFLYLRNHGIRYFSDFSLRNGILGDGWIKTNKEEKIDQSTHAEARFFSEKLNDSIAYLRLPTFANNYNAKIDSLYKASEPLINSSDYLIIDLRNNGGGNDSNAVPFLKHIGLPILDWTLSCEI